jgi:hypothetical protein
MVRARGIKEVWVGHSCPTTVGTPSAAGRSGKSARPTRSLHYAAGLVLPSENFVLARKYTMLL